MNGPPAEAGGPEAGTRGARRRPALDAVAAAVEARLEPEVMLGAAAQGVLGPDEEVEAGPAVVVWCADLGPGRAVPFRAWAMRPERGGIAVAGWPDTRPGELTVVLADPFSFPMGDVARRLGEERPDQPIAGGMVTPGQGASRLLLDGRVHEDGAVGVVLQDVETRTVVSQGCRPVGEPLTVTAVDRNRILELAGAPATQRLRELLDEVDEADRDLMERGGLQVGLVVDEVRDDYRPGDFLIRGVLGVDPDAGTITVGDLVATGQTVQFQVRDADSARADLARRLEGVGPAVGGLLFTCNGRGSGCSVSPTTTCTRSAASSVGPSPGRSAPASSGPWAACPTCTASPPAWWRSGPPASMLEPGGDVVTEPKHLRHRRDKACVHHPPRPGPTSA
jgi:small ligand-binding sensory domain FIST